MTWMLRSNLKSISTVEKGKQACQLTAMKYEEMTISQACKKVATLIKRKRETYMPKDEKRGMRNILREATKWALGDNYGIRDNELNLLLEDKNILEAAKAYKVSRENNDLAARQAARHNLLILLGKAR